MPYKVSASKSYEAGRKRGLGGKAVDKSKRKWCIYDINLMDLERNANIEIKRFPEAKKNF